MLKIGKYKDEYRISNKEYRTAEVLGFFSISNYFDIHYSLFDLAELVAGGVLRFK